MTHDIGQSLSADGSDFRFLSRMPQIMVEAFAKSLIDKIMQEAFDSMENGDEKLRMQNREDLTNTQTRSTIRMNDRPQFEQETMERIGMMVRGLQNLHIGDSSSVPSLLTTLEKQVKHVIHNIDHSTSTADRNRTTEILPVTQGQGDMYQIIHNAVIETPMEPTCSHRDGENSGSNEITRISGSVLRRMIEDLETQVGETDAMKETERDSIGAEDIEAGSKTEEQFARSIKSVDDFDGNIDFQSVGNLKINDYDSLPESTPLSVVQSTSFANDTCLEDVAIEEITPSALRMKNASSPDLSDNKIPKPEKLRKKGIFSRMRKLLRAIFGRRKN
ncbi:uncharacterized protein LOC143216436 [Lasioglossum baleicum]|uniref:uncharacterized protein LOC143216436 n=1 Tax=Lasioglossum baleicum TaxID=434251 RepID=UPI003FCE30AA